MTDLIKVEKFEEIIGGIRATKQISTLEAILDYCEVNEVEVLEIVDLITDVMREDIFASCVEKNLVEFEDVPTLF